MKIIAVVVVVAAGMSLIFWNTLKGGNNGETGSSSKAISNEGSPQKVAVVEKWELPASLKEISALVYMDENRFACVQDEKGIIFIFNRTTGKVEREIRFSGPGDYEGLAIKDHIAWVLRADGRIYEVDMDKESLIAEHKTPLTAKHDVEGLCFDEAGNRLLLAIKNDEPHTKKYKGIYAFDLQTKQFQENPVYRIPMDHSLLKNKKSRFSPAAIALHPQTKDLYITDGPGSRLMIMSSSGEVQQVISLGKQFPQAEGITFSASGDLFISNEGNKQPANILHVKID